MKPLKIVFMLALTVISLSVAVYFVEDITSEIIETRQAAEIEEALQTIFPEIDGANDTLTTVTDADFGVSGIESVIEITNDGNAKGYVYTVAFRGFSSEIKYLVGIDSEGNITGYQVLQQSDTPGYGGQIGDAANWTQFTGMSIETAGNGDFDGLTGATITTTAWKTSLKGLYDYHLATYGYTPKTDAQLLQEKKEAMVGGTYTVEPYTTSNPFANYGITGIDIATDGTTNQAVIYTVEFVGYNASDVNEYMIAFDLNTNEVLGFVTKYSGDSTDFGAEKMLDTANWTQFVGQSTADLLAPNVDGFSGASITGNALEASLQQISIFHQWEFEGVVVLTPEQEFELSKQELFEDAARFENVTAFKPYSPIITNIFDAYDDEDNFLGTIYHVTIIGASYSEFTYVEFLVGINSDDEYTGFRMVSDNETDGKTDDFYEEGYDDSIVSDSVTDPLNLDAVTGSTITFNKIANAITEIALYHVEKYTERPDAVPVDNAALLAAFPTASSFVSVYDDYEFNVFIGNIYEARDGSNAVLGYVYYSTALGFSSSLIEFTWGVDTTGLTQNVHIISGPQTWGAAASSEYSDYTGAFGNDFATSTWIDLFEGVQIASILSSPVDNVAGVSTTTSAMKASLEAIATYHAAESVGGAS